MSSPWNTHNGATAPKPFPTDGSPFKIHAPPKTDIWRRNASDDVFTAPVLYQKIRSRDFERIAVSVFAPWKTQFDQGGLILAFPDSKSGSGEGPALTSTSKWIKAGIEFFAHEAVLGIVGTDRFSDWSLAPMDAAYHQKARFEAKRDGTTLWIYGGQEGKKLKPLREVKWAFLEEREDEAEMWVGVYAAKPTTEQDDAEGTVGIDVTFEGLELEVAK